MNKIVSVEELVSLIREQIENNGEVSFTPKGNSMWPLLRSNKDTVTLRKIHGNLKKYQIVFYLRNNEQYVLHRIVKVERDSYIMRGDNQFANEDSIKKEQMIGVVNRFMRNGKWYECESTFHKIYCKVWVNTIVVRKYIRRCRRIAGKVKRKLLGQNK